MKLRSLCHFLSNSSPEEKSELAEIVFSILHEKKSFLMQDFKLATVDKNKSLLYKTLALSIVIISRILNSGQSSPEKKEHLRKELEFLQKSLNKRNNNSVDDKIEKSLNLFGLDKNLKDAIKIVYQTTVGRTPIDEEIAIWHTHFNNGLSFHEFFLAMISSEEANSKHGTEVSNFPLLSDGEFIQVTYEIMLGRGAQAWEIDEWREKLESSSINRMGLLNAIFNSAYQGRIDIDKPYCHDGLSCLVMGTGFHVSIKDWEYKASELKLKKEREKSNPADLYRRFYIKSEPKYLVSALASLYCGGDFIENFMDNVTQQSGFSDYCELIIVDADSPEDEYTTIKKYLAKYKNINYIRTNYRIGIYDAWNIAVKAARGDYLTNTNLDDLRRHDSFMQQAAVLENLNFVDIVYQDLYYTFDPRLSFEEITEFGLQTTLPIITPHNMLAFNSPHNAPMWRKKLHEELGFFDTRYRSAGDYEFWLRCLSAGKKFYKINDPHVIYYQNPKGLSTRPDTSGLAESCEILKTYARKLVPTEVVISREKLIDDLINLSGLEIKNQGTRYDLAQSALRALAVSKKYSQY